MGGDMLKPYDMLTRCQLVLKNCELPTIDKLQLDMYILRVKMILLDEDRKVRSIYSDNSETEIKDLYDQISSLCGPEGEVADVRRIVERMQSLVEDMKKPLEMTGKE
jgi:hypothetical protein